MTQIHQARAATALRAIGPASAVLCICLASTGHALPADPQRPLSEQTCDAALTRLAEAQIGSPLVPATSHPQLLAMARGDVLRLCGADHIGPSVPTSTP